MVLHILSQITYISVFALTAVVCFGSLTRTTEIEDPDTRRGLSALLGLSGLWAATQAGHVVAPTPRIASAIYTFGLAIGLATVGAWLYFCSAYAGRSYHRKPIYRRLALGVYVLGVGFKLANPWHGLYFETVTVGDPFRYVAIQEQPAFWVIAGASYVFSALGFYMLVDVFEVTGRPSRAAKAVVGLAALPVVFDVIGYLSPPPVLELNYESVGVALFAVGALYVVREPFFSVARYGRVQLADAIDDPVLILDADERVRDYNDAALELFPRVGESDAPRIAAVSETVESALGSEGTVELNRDGETQYVIVRTTPVTVGATDVGRAVVCTDVTEIERQRRELQWKDEQFEGFATSISHELRNSLGVISGQAELLSRLATETDDPDMQSRAERVVAKASEMEEVVEQLQTLARYSQTVSERDTVDLEAVIRAAKDRSDIDGLVVDVEDARRLDAEKERLRELFEQVFEFAARGQATEVVVRGHTDGFEIVEDGQDLEEFDEDAVFSYGNAVPDSSSAMIPPNLQMLATSQGWRTEITDDGTMQIRTEVSREHDRRSAE